MTAPVYVNGTQPLPAARGDLFPVSADTSRFWDGLSINALRQALTELLTQAQQVAMATNYGLACDGATDDFPALTAFIAAAGSKAMTLVIPGPCKVGTNITIPTTLPVRFEGAGAFTGAGVVTYSAVPAGANSASLVLATGSSTARTLAEHTRALAHAGDAWINVKGPPYNAYGDGTHDDTAAIQAAVTAGAGKRIVVPDGDYKVLSGITGIASQTTIFGQSWNARIFSPNDITLFTTANGASGVMIEGLTLEKTGAASSKFHVIGINPVEFTVRNCQIKAQAGFTFAGIAVTDGAAVTNATQAGGFMTNIHDNVISQGSILLTHGDSRIVKNYVWASESTCASTYAVRLQNLANVLVADNDIVPSSGSGGGLSLGGSVSGVIQARVSRNFFDGNGNVSIVTNTGITSDASITVLDSTFEGNVFWRVKSGGIKLPMAHNCRFTGNVFENCNFSGGALFGNGSSDLEVGNALYSTQIIIAHNLFNITEARTVKGYAINLPQTGSNRTDAVLEGNSVVGTGNYRQDGTLAWFNWPGRQRWTSTFRDNLPAFRISGSATVASGTAAAYPRWTGAMPPHTVDPQNLTVRYYTPSLFPPAQWRAEALDINGFNIITNGNVLADSVFYFEYEVR